MSKSRMRRQAIQHGCDLDCPLINENTNLKEAVRYLLSFAPKNKPDPGYFPTSYITLTYEGDLEIFKEIEKIKELIVNG